jgi:hypothetical protein
MHQSNYMKSNIERHAARHCCMSYIVGACCAARERRAAALPRKCNARKLALIRTCMLAASFYTSLDALFLRGGHADCPLDKRVLDLHATNTG